MVSLPAMLSVAEEEGSVQVCATLSILDPTEAITLALYTAGGTGT